jgi:hypothetical protein
VEISGNYIDGWSSRAVWIKEGLDVDVSCNAIVANEVGVHFDRDKYNSAWPPVRFRGNRVRPALDGGAQTAGTRTTNALAIDYGPASSTTGLSFLEEVDGEPFIVENDPNGSNVMNARENHWYIDDTLTDNQSLIQDLITNEISQSETVDTADAEQSEGSKCHPQGVPEVGCSVGGSRISGGGMLLGHSPGAASRTMEDRSDAPLATALGRPRPNPGARGTTIELAIARVAEHFRIDIYDVQGRRVVGLVDGVLAPGRHNIVWNGRDAANRLAAPGVYFVRATSRSYTRTEKVVILK